MPPPRGPRRPRCPRICWRASMSLRGRACPGGASVWTGSSDRRSSFCAVMALVNVVVLAWDRETSEETRWTYEVESPVDETGRAGALRASGGAQLHRRVPAERRWARDAVWCGAPSRRGRRARSVGSQLLRCVAGSALRCSRRSATAPRSRRASCPPRAPTSGSLLRCRGVLPKSLTTSRLEPMDLGSARA